MALKDHQIARLTNDIKDTLLIKMHHINFPDSLREIISESVVSSLSSMNARADHEEVKKAFEIK